MFCVCNFLQSKGTIDDSVNVIKRTFQRKLGAIKTIAAWRHPEISPLGPVYGSCLAARMQVSWTCMLPSWFCLSFSPLCFGLRAVSKPLKRLSKTQQKNVNLIEQSINESSKTGKTWSPGSSLVSGVLGRGPGGHFVPISAQKSRKNDKVTWKTSLEPRWESKAEKLWFEYMRCFFSFLFFILIFCASRFPSNLNGPRIRNECFLEVFSRSKIFQIVAIFLTLIGHLPGSLFESFLGTVAVQLVP